MSRNQSVRARRLWISLASFLLLYLCHLARSRHTQSALTTSPRSSDLFQFLNLSEKQCRATFPDLTRDLDATVALGPFTLKRVQGTGPLQARIKDGQLYIIHSGDTADLSPELIQARQAALYQIHRALITSPEKLPDTIFSLNIRDQPYGTAWSYARPAYAAPAAATPPLTRAFLMPHFAFWNWPLPFIGSISRAGAAISQIEASLAFAQKDARVVWRGSARFNGAHNPTLRQDLLRATAGAAWADVRALESYEGNATAVEDFCRYKYVLYTDGVTYSGRLAFLQMCGSVLLAPPLAWRQLTTHLLRPVFSSDLLAGKGTFIPTDPKGWGGKSEDMRRAWPAHDPEDANAVFVAPDWSDLEATVAWLEEHPGVAEGIAKRQRDLFVGKGYTSPAMETCYWRALIRGWSQVVRLGEDWEHADGVSWDEYSVNWDGII
ncbi:hypothetical protein GQX73_g5742 [Xylaria multiplex]|uniref:Glycosyl transferase CAP10 domain-containing protein n=1 Tax=Xylaria multiplex TaxID=323545 RepID=A0A7C8IMW7_9PEZI|nr:hypothetical protein GQX73_g5742 [Xylaria multiplex]